MNYRKKHPVRGMLSSVDGGYYAVRVDFNCPSSFGELVLVGDLRVGEIKMVCRDSVAFHHLFGELTVCVYAHSDVFRAGFLGFSCKADILDAALRILYAPEIHYHVFSFQI